MNRRSLFLILLGLAAATLPSSSSAQVIEDISFQRLEYRHDGEDPIPLSHFARCLVVYTPGPEASMLNVAARLPAGDPVWIIRNLPLMPDTMAQPQQTLGFRFPLLLLGVDVNEPLADFDIDYTVTPDLLADEDAPGWLAGLGFPHPILLGSAVVEEGSDSWSGDDLEADSIPLVPYYPSFPGGPAAPIYHSDRSLTMPNVDLDRTTDTGDGMGCWPAAQANSMRWLGDVDANINFLRSLRGTYEDMTHLVYRVPGDASRWPRMLHGALDFVEAYELPATVEFQCYLDDTTRTSFTGYTQAVSQHAGAWPGWPTWEWLRDESAAGADVVIGIGKYYEDTYPSGSTYWRRKGGHAVVLTGALTYAGLHIIKYKHDEWQSSAAGTVEEAAYIAWDSAGAMIAVGMGGTMDNHDGDPVPYVARIQRLVSKGYQTGAGTLPHTHTFVDLDDEFYRTIPAGYAIEVTYPVIANRCLNNRLYLYDRETADPHADYLMAWNYNSGETRTWVNLTGHAVTFIMTNEDGYGSYDISYTLGDGSGLVTTPGNPWDFGGFAFGWADGSAAEFGAPEGPVVAVMPDPGLSLDTFPSVMGPAGVVTLHIDYNIETWHETWAELGLNLWVAEVFAPGPLLVDCPVTGYLDELDITEPGLYEIDLGSVAAPGPQLFHMTLDCAMGPSFSIDRLGLPSATPVSATGDPAAAPQVPVLEPGYPNPFNAGTTIAFSLPRAEYAELAVYDLQGRLVRTLRAGHLSAGPHEEVWRGRDNWGRPVASGVYVCRLKSASGTKATKLVLQK